MGDGAAGSCIDGSTKNNCNAVVQHRTEKAQHKSLYLSPSLTHTHSMHAKTSYMMHKNVNKYIKLIIHSSLPKVDVYCTFSACIKIAFMLVGCCYCQGVAMQCLRGMECFFMCCYAVARWLVSDWLSFQVKRAHP